MLQMAMQHDVYTKCSQSWRAGILTAPLAGTSMDRHYAQQQRIQTLWIAIKQETRSAPMGVVMPISISRHTVLVVK